MKPNVVSLCSKEKTSRIILGLLVLFIAGFISVAFFFRIIIYIFGLYLVATGALGACLFIAVMKDK